ncbi:MAG: hypothetical protein KBC34_00865 [Phenylobacterium sp.]|nr:hypothetical protein [Phenylobacterium sp.]
MIDPDNPLPEASFLWRRWLTFAASLALWGLLFLALPRIPGAHLLAFAQSIMIVLVVLWVLYFSGASADDIGRLIARARPAARELPPVDPPPAASPLARSIAGKPNPPLPDWLSPDA